MRKTLVILLTFIIALITPPTFAQNRVLSLDGDGDYVEVADSESLNAINSQVTMEAWIKPTAFPSEWIAIVHKADERTPNSRYGTYVLHLNSAGFIHLASGGKGSMYLNSPAGSIALNTWYHVTGVINAKNGVMRIFLNGAEVASGAFGKDIHVSALPLCIGWTQEEGHGAFAGQIDEVRIWNTARTPEEIRATMHTTLKGKETGLVGFDTQATQPKGYWRFDVGKNITIDSSPSHADGKLIGDAHCVEVELPQPGEVLIPTVVSGKITAENGNPIRYANVRLEQDGEEITQTQSDADGNYHLVISEKVRGSFDLFAMRNELGDLRLGIRLRLGLSAKRIETKGEHRTLNLTLKEAISIEGKLMMLDDTTPHVAVPVQAIRNGEVIEGALSDGNGRYRFANLKPGRYQVRCYVVYVSKPVLIPGEYVYYTESEDNPVVDASQATTLHLELGKTCNDIDFRFAPFKKGIWKHFDTYDGSANNSVFAIHQDPDGIMWFGTGSHLDDGNGVFRYDGKDFVNFTTDDGLVDNTVFAIHRDQSGVLWFGTGRGVSVYATNNGRLRLTDGKSFQNFTVKDGLVSNYVYSIYQASDGVLWFGTGGGVSRYDGKGFVNFTTKDGLSFQSVDDHPSHP